MKAIIEIDIPDYQIGQEVSIYFKDTMMIKGVAQEPKTGHWIKDKDTLECPLCGAKGENIKDDYCFNYCPVCGARMESEE